MTVRAKFKVNAIEYTEGSRPKRDANGAVLKDERGYEVREPCQMATIKMSPTYSTDPNSENKKFWDASPGGQLSLNCVNAEAVSALELGKEYYLDFTPVG